MNRLINILQFERKHVKYLFALAVLVLISMNIVSYMNSRDYIEKETSSIDVIKNLEIIEELRNKINEAQTGRNFYFITGNKNRLKSFYHASNTIDTIYSKLKLVFKENHTQQANLDTLSLLVKQRFDLFNKSIELQERKRTSTSMHKSFTNRGKEIQDKINSFIKKMKNEEYNSLRKNTELADSKAKFTLIILVSGTLFSILTLLFAFILIQRFSTQNYRDPDSHKLSADELETVIRERTAEISQLNRKLNTQIDKLKKTDTALKQSEKELRGIFELAHDAILIFTPKDAKVLDVNRRACEIYGIKPEEFIGLSLKAISKNVPECEEYIKITLEKGNLYNFQTVHYNKEGSEMLMEINASLINYKGQAALLSINRDITDRILSYIPLSGS